MSFLGKLRKKEKKAPAAASESPSLSKPVFPDGIKQLYPPSGTAMEDAEVDICFVHGLTGDREQTWTAKGQSAPWPQTLLPSIFPKARIVTFGYDAYVVQSGVAASNGLDNHAKNLLNDLVADRQECHAKSRPLIFVAHSLGGIVCKQAISFSRSSKFEHLHDIYDSVIGIAFMGTPHRGATLVNWADIPVRTLGVVKSVNTKLTDVLHIGNPLLDRTYNKFLDALAERQKYGRGIHVVCFYEELPIFKNFKVVTEHSATMDGDIAISIHANHMDMVRFASEDGNDFGRLRRELARWMENNRIRDAERTLVKADKLAINDPKNKACIQDLCLTDPDDDRTRIEKKNGTFFENIHDWVFDNAVYKEWKDGNPQSRLLWIRGDPGKGKTMIMCSVIRNLKDSGTPLSYFFCQATNDKLNHAEAVLRGLIYILVKRQPALVAHVRKKYDHMGERLFSDINAWEALSKIFRDIVNDERLAEAVVLVDGLDECTAGRPQLLELIAEPSPVRWLVSSRNWPDIQEGLRGAEQVAELRLELNPDAIGAAVEAYVRLKVEQLAKIKELEHGIRDTMQKYLLANADGTFLWVALVCHAIEPVGRRHVLETLTTFPRGLLPLYNRMVQTIQDGADADDCCGILAVASTVYRPITSAELQVLLPSLAHFDMKDLEEIIQLCGSFLTLRSGALYFVHQSAKDYLMSEAQHKIFPRGLPDQHLAIASRSLAAISDVLRRDMYGLKHPGYAIEEVKPPANDPLAPVAYSCIFWIDHLADAATSQRSVTLQDGNEVHRFFLEKYLYWLEALSLMKNVWAGATAVRKLKTMIDKKEQNLASFVYDAQRFISFCANSIATAPLQAYASALLFSPANSKVRRQFAGEEPNWVTVKPGPPANWDACEQTLEGHSSRVRSVAFSPDSHKLASGSFDKTIKVWDLVSGQCTYTLRGHTNEILSVAFSPDGQKLVSGSLNTTIKVWDVVSGKCTHTFNGYTKGILSVAFSPDSQKLASGSQHGLIKVWDLVSGQCAHTLLGHIGFVQSIAFSADGQTLASGGKDKKVKVWDVESGQCKRTLEGHPDFIRVVAFSPDGQGLISASRDRTIMTWNVESGQCTQTTRDDFGGYVVLKALSADGHKVAGYDRKNGAVKVLDLAGRSVRTLFSSTALYVMKFSSEGQYLATGVSTDVKIWNLEAEQAVQADEGDGQTQDANGWWFSSIAFSPEGQYLAIGNLFGTARIFDVATGQPVAKFRKHYNTIIAIAFSPGRRFLATLSSDIVVQIFSLELKAVVQKIEGFSGRAFPASIAFSPEGRYLAMQRDDQGVEVLDLATGPLARSATGHGETVETVFFRRTVLIAAWICENLGLWDRTAHTNANQLGGSLVIVRMD